MPNDHSSSRDEGLRAIVGDWAMAGYVTGDPPVPVYGSDVYEVLPGGYFLVHHVDVTVGAQAVRAIEVIGEPSAHRGAFLARSYDNHGNTEVMELTIDDDGVFHFSGGPDIAPTAQPSHASTARVKSTLAVASDGDSMTALWERSEDGVRWEPWMNMTFTRRTEPDRR
jgi:hypothetical protein